MHQKINQFNEALKHYDNNLIEKICVFDSNDTPVSDTNLSKEIIIANNNISHVINGTVLSAWDINSISPELITFGGVYYDNNASPYKIWVPLQTTEWWRDSFLYPALSSRDKRKDLYQELLYHIVLQPEINKKLIEDGTIFKQVISKIETAAQHANDGSDAYELLKKNYIRYGN